MMPDYNIRSGSAKTDNDSNTKRMPQDKGEIVVLLALFAELEQSQVSVGWIHEIHDQGINLVVVVYISDKRAMGVVH